MTGNIVARSRMEKIRNYMMVIVLGGCPRIENQST